MKLELSVSQAVFGGHFDERKSKRSKSCTPFGQQRVEILAGGNRRTGPAGFCYTDKSANDGATISRPALKRAQRHPRSGSGSAW